jgi:hypothetical protein
MEKNLKGTFANQMSRENEKNRGPPFNGNNTNVNKKHYCSLLFQHFDSI